MHQHVRESLRTHLYLLEESFAAHVHRRPIMLTPLDRSLMFLPRVLFPESHVYPRQGEVREFKAQTILRSFQWPDKHVEYNPEQYYATQTGWTAREL